MGIATARGQELCSAQAAAAIIATNLYAPLAVVLVGGLSPNLA